MNHSLHETQTKLLSVGQHSKSVILNSNLCGFLLKWLDFDYKMWLLSVNVITSLEKVMKSNTDYDLKKILNTLVRIQINCRTEIKTKYENSITIQNSD